MAECIVDIDYRGQLIRCEDCKYYDRQNEEVWEWGLCSRYKVAGINIAVNYDEYCSKGERKTDTAEDTAPSFMSEWAREIDEQMAKLTIRKDSSEK